MFSYGENLTDKTQAFINDLFIILSFLTTGTFLCTLTSNYIVAYAYAYNLQAVSNYLFIPIHLHKKGGLANCLFFYAHFQ